MHTAALFLIFFAMLLACWGFSVIVRSASEWMFFRRYPKATARRSGRWWSPLVGVLALMSSAYPCWLGLSWASMDSGATFAWLHAVAAGVGVFGVWLGIMWAIGDRPRGRRRCTRCLYDLSGTPGLQCPECGRVFKSEQHLSRPRRGRVSLAISVLLLTVSIFGFTRVKKVVDHGPLMLVPTPVLLAGWRWLPEQVICFWDKDTIDGCLEDRIEHIDGMDLHRRVELADRFLSRMERSESIRWNRRASSIVWACLGFGRIDNSEIESSPEIKQLGQKYAGLFDQVGVELVPAATGRALGPADAERVELLPGFSGYKHPYLLLQRLTDTIAATDEDELAASYYVNIVRSRHMLLSQTKSVLSESDAEVHLQNNPFDNELLIEIMVDSGYISDHLPALLPAYPLTTPDQSGYAIIRLAWSLAVTDDENRLAMLDHMTVSARSGDAQTVAIVYMTASRWGRYSPLNLQPMPDTFRSGMLAVAIEHGLNDTRISFPAIEEWSSSTVRKQAQITILRLDQTGGIAMPMLREWLVNGETDVSYPMDNCTDDIVSKWLKHFSDLVSHPDPAIREWVAESFPLPTDTQHDDRICAMLRSLAEDPDGRVAESASESLQGWREVAPNP